MIQEGILVFINQKITKSIILEYSDTDLKCRIYILNKSINAKFEPKIMKNKAAFELSIQS